MKEHPIIFSSEMVRAILDGRKTQTRRIIKMPEGIAEKYEYRGDDGGNELLPKESGHYWINGYAIWRPNLKYQVGDRIWVKETWNWGREYDSGHIVFINNPGTLPIPEWAKVVYKTDNNKQVPDKWIPSIFMRKIFARIFLEITNIRVERVQDISDENAKAEGCHRQRYHNVEANVFDEHTARYGFKNLWDSLNANRGFGWDKNPWVWVIEFKQESECCDDYSEDSDPDSICA